MDHKKVVLALNVTYNFVIDKFFLFEAIWSPKYLF
jgi:hypothetical protein